MRTKFAVKLATFLLALATGVGGFWASLFILSQWDTLWTGTGYYTSNSYYQDLNNRFYQARELALLLQHKEWNNGTLPYLDQQRLADLEALLDPEQTNFRFAFRHQFFPFVLHLFLFLIKDSNASGHHSYHDEHYAPYTNRRRYFNR